MPSPFPGMNPFLERPSVWEEFHDDFLLRARDVLIRQAGPHYIVKTGIRLILRDIPAGERVFFGIADAGVLGTEELEETGRTTATLEAPVRLLLPDMEVEKQHFLEIRDREDQRVVTVLELLSPSNKTPGKDRDQYLGKRLEILGSTTNFVEIDLRRAGRRPEIPELPKCDYYALVSRVNSRPVLGCWPIGLREQLPEIPIPLDAGDADLHLDLKVVLDLAYDAGDYAKYLYKSPPDPPLAPDDESWARQLVAQSLART